MPQSRFWAASAMAKASRLMARSTLIGPRKSPKEARMPSDSVIAVAPHRMMTQSCGDMATPREA